MTSLQGKVPEQILRLFDARAVEVEEKQVQAARLGKSRQLPERQPSKSASAELSVVVPPASLGPAETVAHENRKLGS